MVDAAARLYEALNAVEIASGKDLPDEWPASPFLCLQVEPEQLGQLSREGNSQERLQAALGVLRQATIQDADDEAGRIFGRRRPEVGTPFGDLVKAWTEGCPDATASWLDALAQQVAKGAEWAFPPLRWELMRSVDDEDNAVYAPTVNRIRRWPSKRMQFDVYFQKFTLTADRKTVKMGIPQDLPTDAAGND